MEPHWNKLVLPKPPTNTWRCVSKEFDSADFLKAINNTIVELESQKVLETEAAILSRLIYRMKSKLRSDKGLKNMEKVNRALLNYLKLSLLEDFKYLRENTESTGDILALPSRQMLEYVLVRTQGFAKLMCRIEEVARIAGTFFKARINLGQAWNISVIAYSVVSRIWMLSRHLTKRSCDWYKKLYKFFPKLKTVGIPWLPQDYKLPENLKTWLFVPWIDEEIKEPIVYEKEVLTDNIFNLITREEAEESAEIELEETKEPSVDQIEDILHKRVLEKKSDEVISSPMEIGEKISRDSFGMDSKQLENRETKKRKKDEASDEKKNIKSAKMDKKSKKSKIPSVDSLETTRDVLKFLSLDSHPGLDKLQWKLVKKNVKKLLLKLNKKFASVEEVKRQKIILKEVIEALRNWIT